MTGGTRKRGATWSYYFDLGKIDGKRQKKEKGGFKTKKESETALAKAINEYNNAGAVFTPSEITVSDYLDQWYDLYCKPNLKYSTQVAYLQIIEGHLKPKYGKYRLKAITSSFSCSMFNGGKWVANHHFSSLKNAKNQGFMRVNAVIHSQCFVLGNRSTGWTFSVR